MRRFIKITLYFVLFLCIAAVFIVENVLPYSGIKPFRLKPNLHSWRFPKGYKPQDFSLQGREMWFVTADSLQLKGYWSTARGDTARGTIIVLHGIASCKETQFEKAAMLAQKGFNALALDLRAHGESGGDYCTFGYYEKNDLKTVVDSLLRQPGLAHPLGIWGVSLGGAIALQSLGNDPRLEFGIIESTFDEFNKVALEYSADMMLGIKSEWLTGHVLDKSAIIARFDPDSVQPVAAAARIRCPVLFIHGDADDKIPPAFNRRNYSAIHSTEKQWISVPGGTHHNVWSVGGEALKEKVYAFLERLKRDEPGQETGMGTLRTNAHSSF
jgi:uncharacterized protein